MVVLLRDLFDIDIYDHLLDEPVVKSRTPGEVLVMDEDRLWGFLRYTR